MEIEYKVLESLKAEDNQSLIQYLDRKFNHDIEPQVWDWEYNSIPNTVFAIVINQSRIVGTQVMLPIFIRTQSSLFLSAKAETGYLDPSCRGKNIYNQLFHFATDKLIEKGLQLTWGFTHAPKAFQKIGCKIKDSIIYFSEAQVRYFSFFRNYRKSRNIIFALGKWGVSNYYYLKNQIKLAILLKHDNSIEVTTSLKDIFDKDVLLKKIQSVIPELVFIQQTDSYINWRVKNNPNIKYKQLFFYKEKELIGYVTYSIHEEKLILSDLTYCIKSDCLECIISYLSRKLNEKFSTIFYWGNHNCLINKRIFEILKLLGAKKKLDRNRCLIYENYTSNILIENTSNWYINGLWTEGFHI